MQFLGSNILTDILFDSEQVGYCRKFLRLKSDLYLGWNLGFFSITEQSVLT